MSYFYSIVYEFSWISNKSSTMESLTVNISYRPLKIGWAIRKGDIEAFRSVLKLTCTFWGGTFNPIIVIDNKEETDKLINLFRIDFIQAIDDSDCVSELQNRYQHLIRPILHKSLHIKTNSGSCSQILDIENALCHYQNTHHLEKIKKEVCVYNWEIDDRLSDIFLMQLGDYPKKDILGIDYKEILKQGTNAKVINLENKLPIPPYILDSGRKNGGT